MSRNPCTSTPSGRGRKKPRLHLRPGKRYGEELRKLSLLQLEAAREGLRGNIASPGPVHDARTFIKKVRAMLDLAAPSLSNKELNRTVRLLRDAASRLSPLRDSDVAVETLDLALEQTSMPADAFDSIRAGLVNVAKQQRINGRHQLPRVRNSLSKAAGGISKMPLDRMSDHDLQRRLRRSYRRARKSLKTLQTKNDPELFHRWRKLAKQVWYQLRVTAPFWPDHAKKLIATLDSIGDLAGKERDLMLLEGTLSSGPSGRSVSELVARITIIRQSLRNEAVGIGREFFMPRPRVFIEPLRTR